MRLYEFQEADDELPDESNAIASIANLITVLTFVIKRIEDEGSEPVINTQSLINMVSNTGIPFDYNALVDSYEKNDAVKNLINNFNQNEITLISGSGDELGDIGDTGESEDSGEAISRIAKRVAQRGIS